MKYIFEVNMMVPVRFEVAANTPREAMKKLFEMNNYNCWEYTDSYNCGEWLKDTDICDLGAISLFDENNNMRDYDSGDVERILNDKSAHTEKGSSI